MLMVDNLMDLTHLGHLHAKTVGGNPAAHVDAEMKTIRTPRGLKFTRWMKNSVPPPSYVKAAGFAGRVDRCQEFEFVAPSTVLQWTGATDVGSDYADPQRDFRFQFRLFHGLTPETETSCFYFWSVANGYRQNEPEATEQLYREIATTFIEEKTMVEAQQAMLSSSTASKRARATRGNSWGTVILSKIRVMFRENVPSSCLSTSSLPLPLRIAARMLSTRGLM